MRRRIIKINEELCDGCGECISSCSEGALEIVNGKAKLIKDNYCDGFGDCVGECHTGALTIEQREAEDFDLTAVANHVKQLRGAEGLRILEQANKEHTAKETLKAINGDGVGGGCPGSRVQTIQRKEIKPGELRSNFRPSYTIRISSVAGAVASCSSRRSLF